MNNHEFHRFDLNDYKNKLPQNIDEFFDLDKEKPSEEELNKYQEQRSKSKDVFDVDQNSDKIIFDEIENKKIIGFGSYGDVYEIEARLGEHKRKFAIKDYFQADGRSTEDAVNYCTRAYSQYLWAKEIGLKVFPTVRLAKNKHQLLLTLVDNDQFYISDKQDSIPTNNKVEMINNLSSMVSSIKSEIIKAVANRTYLSDCYFFLINNNNPQNINFIIGDYDYIFKVDNSYDNNLRGCVSSAFSSLKHLVQMMISDKDTKLKIIDNIEAEFEEFKLEYSNKSRDYWQQKKNINIDKKHT